MKKLFPFRSHIYQFCCFYLFLLSSPVYAQTLNSTFEKITIKDGLSQSTGTYIIQDKKGFMWFATYDGLNKYDGFIFKKYRHTEIDSTSLNHNSIIYMYEDKDGYIWLVNNGNAGLNRFNPETENFTLYIHNPNDSTSISSNEIYHVIQDRSGNIWVCTTSALDLVIKHPSKTGSKIIFKRFYNSYSTQPFSMAFEDKKGKLLLFADFLYYFDRDKEEIIKTDTKLSDSEIISISEDKSGNIWLGTSENGIIKLHYDENKNMYVRVSSNDVNVTPENRNYTLIDNQDRIWVATESLGLFLFNDNEELLYNFVNDDLNPNSLSDNTVYSLYINNSGILWIGTFSQGLCKYNLYKKKFSHFKSIPGNKNSLSGNVISSIHSQNMNELWVGVDLDGGVNHIIFNDDKEPEFIHYKHDPNNPNTIAGSSVLCLVQRKNGDVWVGSAGGSISKIAAQKTSYNRKSKITRYQHDRWTFSIFEDSEEILWGGTWDGGLWRYDDKQDKFTYFLHAQDNPSSLCDNIIWAIAEDNYGNLWIGGHGEGLSILPKGEKHKENPKFINYKYIQGDKTSLSNNTINTFCQDQSGTMWIGTGGGLNKVINKSESFKNVGAIKELIFHSYHLNDGLPSEGIIGIVEDNNGNLWLSTSNGISNFNVSDTTFTNYSESDGLQSDEFWHNAYFKDQKGRLYFGGQNGFNAFYPDSIKSNPFIPKIVFTDLKIFNKSVKIDEKVNGDIIISKSITQTSEIVLSHRNNIFTIEFAALHFTQPLKNKYLYKLEGFDEDWVEKSADRHFASYTNLPAGDYIFKVKASNNDGVWNEEGVSLKILITPPFWATWWFRLLTIGFIIIAVIVFYQKRTYNIKQRNKELEHKVQERTHELADERNLLKTLINIIPDHIYVKDKFSRFILNNKSHLHLLGATKQEDVIGKTDKDIFPAEFSEKYYDDEKMIIQTGQSQINKEEIVKDLTDNRQYYVSATKVRFMNSKGDVEGIVGISHDITDRKEFEEDLKQAKIDADLANLYKSEFLANMSHEIRTPMNGVIGMTELASDMAINKQQKEYLMFAKQSAESLLDILNDILDFSKIEAGKLELEIDDFNLRKVVENAASSMIIQAHTKGLELMSEVKTNVPVAVQGDSGRLRQIIINLIGNAIKFTESGEIVVRVELNDTSKQNGSDSIGFHFSVSDTGIGIPKNKLTKIFESFSQADNSTTRKYGGTGLGLSISQALAELMGGKIWVESEVGKGSTFHFTARFKPGQLKDEDTIQHAKINYKGFRVLIVDDNNTNCIILKDMMEIWGFNTTIARNGEKALNELYKATVEEKLFDIILLDYQMPEMDGFELAKKIRANAKWKNVRIFIMSSISEKGSIQKSKRIGIDYYLNKPVRQAELYTTITTTLGKTQNKKIKKEKNQTADKAVTTLKILLVEDNIINQKVAANSLKKWGHEVTVANDGVEAMELFNNHDFDLIFMDIQMPNMDGIEATKKIRDAGNSKSDIPIIAMTAHAMKGDRERFLDAGMDDYISKPISVLGIKRILQKYSINQDAQINSKD